jgi:hypothetical protein
MPRTRRSPPGVESLEGRMLLSAVRVPVAHAPALVASTASGRRLVLDGTLQGTWSKTQANPDVGGSETLQGWGSTQPLGQVQATGTLQTPGFIRSARATGSLTLSNAQGSVTLRLVGVMGQPGSSSSPPSALRYTVVKGTGQYAQATGSGTALLQQRPLQRPAPGPPGTMTPDYVIAPSFTLTFAT